MVKKVDLEKQYRDKLCDTLTKIIEKSLTKEEKELYY